MVDINRCRDGDSRMSVSSDKIREMVDGYPAQIDSLQKSLQSINAQITDLNEQQSALQTGALDVIANQLVTVLLPPKATNPHVYTFGGFGDYGSSGNATDWEVYDLINNTAVFTQVSSSEFVVEGVNITGQLSAGEKIVVTNNGVFSVPAVTTTVTVTGAPYPANSTYVLVAGSIVQATIDGVWKLVYEYLGVGWDSDPAIQQEIDDYAFIIDHLHKALGTGGTYGIIALEAALTTGQGIVAANKNKITGAETTYDRFGT